MNLKLKRLVRTNSSEQYALFDLDQINAEHQPTTIGKIDMHYTNEGVYGTILLWDDASRDMGSVQRKDLVQILLDEISTPMGVPSEYVFEFFAPTLDEYEVIHNVGLDVAEDEEDPLNDEPGDGLLDDSRDGVASGEPIDAEPFSGVQSNVQVEGDVAAA